MTVGMLQQQPNQQLHLQAFRATPVGSRGVKAQASITKDTGSGRRVGVLAALFSCYLFLFGLVQTCMHG